MPGAIQPHGAVLAVATGTRRITHASDNAATMLGLRPGQVLGLELTDVLGDEACSRLLAVSAAAGEGRAQAQHLWLRPDGTTVFLRAYASGARTCIDIETVGPDTPGLPVGALESVLESLAGASTEADLFERVVTGLKQISGYDRVMVYRFADDGHGEIVAECREAGLSPYLGLHYPAADIPPQARRQFVAQAVGSVVDASYIPVVINAEAAADLAEPLDLTHSALRSVSPIHRQYMHNMQTAASLTVGLARDDVLWGMLFCHHTSPRRPGHALRAAAGLLGMTVSLVCSSLRASAAAAETRRRDAALLRCVASLAPELPLCEALEHAQVDLLRTLDAEGAVALVSGEEIFMGRTPAPAAVRRALAVLATVADGGVLALDDVGRRFPELGECTSMGSGVLWLPLDVQRRDIIVFFRPEVPRTLVWGGDPAAHPGVDAGTGRPAPRSSFAAWKQTVTGVSRPWSEADRLMAATVASVLTDAFARRRAAALRDADAGALLAAAQLGRPVAPGVSDVFSAMVPAGLAEPESAYESLMQFLYLAPVGLVQSSLDGSVEMMNPMSATLLMPLSTDGNLDNLFVTLAAIAPWLPQRIAAFNEPSGSVCDAVRIAVAHERPGGMVSKTLSLSVRKLDENRLMTMLGDVTLEVEREQVGLERRLYAAARIDALTQMPNRAAIWELVSNALQRRAHDAIEDFAVLFINCDRFKQINDSLGHGAGDEVLGLMSERLQSTLRQQPRGAANPGDEADRNIADTAGRIGGDEFVVLIGNLKSAEDAHLVAHRLIAVLSKPYSVLGHRLHVGVSMGLILRRDMNGDADAVVKDASIAMREAKRAGGGRYLLFERVMQERALRRGALEIELRRALGQDQFFVVYQPVVELQQDQNPSDLPAHAAGVEALVRWRHPERGLVPPLDFIGMAEECGLIGEIGEFVLFTACHQFVEWQGKLGRSAPRLLAVNLSRGQLVQPGFADTVARVLASSGIRADQLQLEITESLAAQDAAVQAELRALQAMGLTLALDDFGTGYSSLSSLHQLPVSTVKIDRSFVSDAVESAHHQVLIEATIRVARSLGMGTVAEGIETREQCALLRQLGCKKGQGYFFSRPLEPADLLEWFATPKPDPSTW